MEFQDAVDLGYYFDRCVDLYFYDDNKTLLGILKCPKRSIKPSITVKGEFIEGEYAISSYISVQNMAYDVDVNAVSYIDCHMYYGGLNDSHAYSEETEGVRQGHSILFSVLYADQEKEPPNRAVRFQCTVAAQDKKRFDTKVTITPDTGKVVSGKNNVAVTKGNGKKGSNSVTLIELLKSAAKAYNETVSSASSDKYRINDKLMIKAIECDKESAETKINISPGKYSIGDLFRKLNSYKTDGTKDIGFCRWKICMNSGMICVSRITPPDWRDVAVAQGYTTEEQQLEYITNYHKKEMNIYQISSNGSARPSLNTTPVYLNYVKQAYRTEISMNVVTMYDDRIRPGCFCVIQGNAIMGRHLGRGGKSGSRLIHTTNQMVLFRVTGGVEFEFSTTEDCSMTLIGAIIDEDYKGTAKSKLLLAGPEGSLSYVTEGDID